MYNYLYADPSVFAGIASCIDLFAIYNMFNESSSSDAADKRAILSDILAIRKDFNIAYNEVINVA